MAIKAIDTTKGLDYTLIAKLLVGEVNPFISTNTYLAVGNSIAVVADGQTDLQGANKARILMDVGYPKIDPDGIGEGNKIRFRATIDDITANFDINEWGIVDSSVGGNLLLRIVEDMQPKVSGTTWIFERDIDLSEVV